MGEQKDADVKTGAMIALIPTEDDIARIQFEDDGEAEPGDQLHLTDAVLGKAADIPEEQQRALIAAMGKVAAAFPPTEARAFSVNIFNPQDEDPCVVLGVSGTELTDLHDAIIDHMRSEGDTELPPDAHQPWIPHITLVYYKDGYEDWVKQAAESNRLGPLTFDRIRLAFAGQTTDVPLTGTVATKTMYEMKRSKLPKTQKCKYGDEPATKRLVWEGRAYVPVCDDHMDKGRAELRKEGSRPVWVYDMDGKKIGEMKTEVAMEQKAIRRVRTPAGVRRYHRPIGSIIVGEGLLHNIELANGEFDGWERVRDRHTGHEYDLGFDDQRHQWIATNAGGGWDPVVSADTEEELYLILDDHLTPEGQQRPSLARRATEQLRPSTNVRASIAEDLGGGANTITDNHPDNPANNSLIDILHGYGGADIDGRQTYDGANEFETRAALRRWVDDNPNADPEVIGVAQDAIRSLTSNAGLPARNSIAQDEQRGAEIAGREREQANTPRQVRLGQVSEGMWINLPDRNADAWYRVDNISVHSTARRSFRVTDQNGRRTNVNQVTNRETINTAAEPPSHVSQPESVATGRGPDVQAASDNLVQEAQQRSAPTPINPGATDGREHLRRIQSDYAGYQAYEGTDGTTYHVGRAEDDGMYYATGPGEWDDIVAGPVRTRREALDALNTEVASRANPAAAQPQVDAGHRETLQHEAVTRLRNQQTRVSAGTANPDAAQRALGEADLSPRTRGEVQDVLQGVDDNSMTPREGVAQIGRIMERSPEGERVQLAQIGYALYQERIGALDPAITGAQPTPTVPGSATHVTPEDRRAFIGEGERAQNLTVVDSQYEGYDAYQGANGDTYYVAQEGRHWVSYDGADNELGRSSDRRRLMRSLDQFAAADDTARVSSRRTPSQARRQAAQVPNLPTLTEAQRERLRRQAQNSPILQSLIDGYNQRSAYTRHVRAQTLRQFMQELKAITPGGREGDPTPRNLSPRENWVDKRGGLPRYIRFVRNMFLRRGYSMGHATAAAVNAVKRWARGGDHVRPQVQAAAAAAIAHWEAMKA